jgi:zinc transport system substrate-binding protein
MKTHETNLWRVSPWLGLASLLFLLGGAQAKAQTAKPVASPTGTAALRIMTSFYPMYIATLNVAGGIPGVEVRNLTQPQTGCLHDYHMTPEDLIQLGAADIFVVNGAGMEAFLDKVVRQRPALKIVTASDGIELIRGEGEEGGNPHVWVSVALHLQQVRSIAAQLAQADPAHADGYRRNAAAYQVRLEGLRTKMHDGLKDIQTRDIITFHEAFPYFAKEFGLNIVAVIEREPGSEPSAKELADTIGIVKRAKTKALFAEPQYPSKAADTIAHESGARVYTLDPGVTGPMEADAYLEIMERNLAELQKALKRR